MNQVKETFLLQVKSNSAESKSKFDWLWKMDTLYKLSVGQDEKSLIRVLRILFG